MWVDRLSAITFAILISGASQASVPPVNFDFRPTTIGSKGPGLFCLSGFTVLLTADESATVRQIAPWANESRIALREGQLAVAESFSGSPTGKRYQRVGEGWLLKIGTSGNLRYQYDDGLPGVTEITTTPAWNLKAKALLNRINFVVPKLGQAACIKGSEVK